MSLAALSSHLHCQHHNTQTETIRRADDDGQESQGQRSRMTTLTMRMIKGDFVVTGPDIEPTKFKSCREAKDWCKAHHPGSPITEIGPDGKAQTPASGTKVVKR
jgi:hypothetical protein